VCTGQIYGSLSIDNEREVIADFSTLRTAQFVPNIVFGSSMCGKIRNITINGRPISNRTDYYQKSGTVNGSFNNNIFQ
jgi:hypothetical protein